MAEVSVCCGLDINAVFGGVVPGGSSPSQTPPPGMWAPNAAGSARTERARGSDDSEGLSADADREALLWSDDSDDEAIGEATAGARAPARSASSAAASSRRLGEEANPAIGDGGVPEPPRGGGEGLNGDQASSHGRGGGGGLGAWHGGGGGGNVADAHGSGATAVSRGASTANGVPKSSDMGVAGAAGDARVAPGTPLQASERSVAAVVSQSGGRGGVVDPSVAELANVAARVGAKPKADGDNGGGQGGVLDLWPSSGGESAPGTLRGGGGEGFPPPPPNEVDPSYDPDDSLDWLKGSCWAPRKTGQRACDARDFFDTKACLQAAFKSDMSHTSGGRALKEAHEQGVKTGVTSRRSYGSKHLTVEQQKAIRDCVERWYPVLVRIFNFYCAVGARQRTEQSTRASLHLRLAPSILMRPRNQRTRAHATPMCAV